MKDKNLPDDIKNKSLNELTDLANNIIKNLENKNTLDGSIEEYQKLIKLNLLIEKQFQKASKELSQSTREKIQNVLKKNEKKKLNKVAKDTNLFLKKFIFKQKKTDLLNPIKYGLLPGGKKIRSKLIVDVGRIFNIDYKKLIQIGAAVECIHAYSLIHDDLPCMDNDRLRRGKLSTHAKFGESTAILAGNSLLTIAFEILSQSTLKIDYKSKINLISLLSKSAGHTGIAGGQYSDLKFEKKEEIFKKIVDMQINKTGKLFSFCCMAPVILSKKQIFKLIQFYRFKNRITISNCR